MGTDAAFLIDMRGVAPAERDAFTRSARVALADVEGLTVPDPDTPPNRRLGWYCSPTHAHLVHVGSSARHVTDKIGQGADRYHAYWPMVAEQARQVVSAFAPRPVYYTSDDWDYDLLLPVDTGDHHWAARLVDDRFFDDMQAAYDLRAEQQPTSGSAGTA